MGAVQIAYTLSAAADVEVQVLNMAGRTVATIPVEPSEAGTHTAFWPGRSASGSKVPPGQYLLRIDCKADDGVASTRLVTVGVR